MTDRARQYFSISGMSCTVCSGRVERKVSALSGVVSVQVSLPAGGMSVVYEPATITPEQIANEVTGIGYPTVISDGTPAQQRNTQTGGRKRQFLLSLLFLLPLCLLHHTGSNSAVGIAAQALCLLPILYLNRQYFSRGFSALLQKAPNMDSLVTLGATAAVIGSGFSLLFAPGQSVHFESAGMILTIITLGKWLEARATSHTGDAIRKLHDLLPTVATVIRNGEPVTIPAGKVRKGDILRILPGETIPADGIILSGRSAVTESALTGESMPTEKSTGDTVYASTINGNGLLQVQVTAPGAASALADIIRLVSEACATKAPISGTADRVARIFVPVVISLACITAAAHAVWGADFAAALSRGIAVLVVSCPCALGLATPVALMVGIGRGAESGILFRNGKALETTGRLHTLAFDKTGTLTCGTPKLCNVQPADGHTAEELLNLIALIESGANHPLAKAVAAACPHPTGTCTDITYTPGRGITADIGNGRAAVGNAELMKELGIHADTSAAEREADMGRTPLFAAANGHSIGYISVADPLRSHAAEAIDRLKALGIMVCMLTGDNTRTARAVAAAAGIADFRAECLPGDKERIIAELRKNGRTVGMVGDGINDTPALARADVAIAPGGGTDVARESADVILLRNKPFDVSEAVRLSRAVIRNIRQNLAWAFLYNIIAIPAAAGVFQPLTGIQLPPAAAAAAMGISSLCVVTNALRLRRFRFHTPINTMKTIELTVRGMMCPHCEKHVVAALTSIPGIGECSANHSTDSVTIRTEAEDPTALIQATKDAVIKAGYEVE